jgi:hypothetical protein
VIFSLSLIVSLKMKETMKEKVGLATYHAGCSCLANPRTVFLLAEM